MVTDEGPLLETLDRIGSTPTILYFDCSCSKSLPTDVMDIKISGLILFYGTELVVALFYGTESTHTYIYNTSIVFLMVSII